MSITNARRTLFQRYLSEAKARQALVNQEVACWTEALAALDREDVRVVRETGQLQWEKLQKQAARKRKRRK